MRWAALPGRLGDAAHDDRAGLGAYTEVTSSFRCSGPRRVGLAGLWWPTPELGGALHPPTRAPEPFTALGGSSPRSCFRCWSSMAAGTIDSDWWVELVVGTSPAWSPWGGRPSPRDSGPDLDHARDRPRPAGILDCGRADRGPGDRRRDRLLQRRWVERFEDRGGWSSALLLFGAYLWAVAALLRLIGFATSWLRMVEAIAIGALLVRLVLHQRESSPATTVPSPRSLTVGRLAAVVGVLLLVEVAIGVYAVIRRREAEIGPVITEKGALPHWAIPLVPRPRHRHRGDRRARARRRGRCRARGVRRRGSRPADAGGRRDQGRGAGRGDPARAAAEGSRGRREAVGAGPSSQSSPSARIRSGCPRRSTSTSPSRS